MAFTIENIEKLAHLSRLALSKDACEQMGKDLSQVLEYVERLNEVDVANVQPMTHAVPVQLRLRADVAEAGIGRKALEGSAGFEDGLVKVPKIIE